MSDDITTTLEDSGAKSQQIGEIIALLLSPIHSILGQIQTGERIVAAVVQALAARDD